MRLSLQSLRALVPALAFAGLLLAVNSQLFRDPLVDDGDIAANSLQVHHARAFKEMLGNYSRWEFHHPGPVFFYLYAGGEVLLCDWLHVVPAPMNAQIVTQLLVNTALLFAAIGIMGRFFPGRWFPPLALSAAVLVVYLLNRTEGSSALVSNWMPHVALFPFLFFAVACASVAAGRARDLPLMALGAMTMVHLHVAQVLFASALCGLACAALLVGAWRHGVLRLVRENRWAIAGSVAIVLVFLLPIGLELMLDKPNNLDRIRTYLEHYPSPMRGIGIATRYLLSFVVFAKDADSRAFTSGEGPLAPLGFPAYVVAYGCLSAAGLCAAIVLLLRNRKLRSRFVLTLLAEGVAIGALFLYWAIRIAGEMYLFNGYFINAMHVLGWWLVVGVVSAWLAVRDAIPVWWTRAAWAVPFLCVTAVAGEFRNLGTSTDRVPRIAAGLSAEGTYELVFVHDDWPTATGVANQLARRGQAFCVSAGWGFMFGYHNVCRPGGATHKTVITATAAYPEGQVPLKLPAILDFGGMTARAEGFYPPLDGHNWSGPSANLYFRLDQETLRPGYLITVTGSVVPYRPVELLLNGRAVGVVDGIWNSSTALPVPREALRPGQDNVMTFRTAAAGPTSGDARTLGFALVSVRIDGAPR